MTTATVDHPAARLAVATARILFVDDHPLVLTGVADMLRGCGHAVATASTLTGAADALEDEGATYDLLLLDLNLAQENGLGLLERGRGRLPSRTVMLSGVTEQEWIFKGFELGAFGFISKSIQPAELTDAIAAVIAETRPVDAGWIWDSQRRRLVDAYDYFPRETVLTPKERAVFMLMREGKLDKQIADDLGLSIHTVRVHIRAIKRKRGHNRRFEQLF